MDIKISSVQSAAVKRFLLVLAACGNNGSAVSTPYARDVERICDAVRLAGAEHMPEADRAYAIAMWLGANLQTTEAHDYLVRIQPLGGADKARALDAEARHVGLARCALADEWRDL